MNTTNALLDRVRDVKGLTSDYQLAKLLETTPQNVSNWRSNRNGMDNTTAMMVAEHLKANPIEILARLQMDKKLSKRSEKVWSKYVSRILLAPFITAALLTGGDVDADEKEKLSPEQRAALKKLAQEALYEEMKDAENRLPPKKIETKEGDLERQDDKGEQFNNTYVMRTSEYILYAVKYLEQKSKLLGRVITKRASHVFCDALGQAMATTL